MLDAFNEILLSTADTRMSSQRCDNVQTQARQNLSVEREGRYTQNSTASRGAPGISLLLGEGEPTLGLPHTSWATHTGLMGKEEEDNAELGGGEVR